MPIEPRPARDWTLRAGALAACCLLAPARAGAAAPELKATIDGAPEIVFSPQRDACDGGDVPDVNARAFRGADGAVSMFALHYVNRALRGPDLDHLKIDCAVALGSGFKADPAEYNDQSWIAATWTPDGTRVAALVHHEYHGDRHGKCDASKGKPGLACWYNTIVPAASADGGRVFEKLPGVVAAPPFRQEFNPGWHRGFFNPSNIFRSGDFYYMYALTTGWEKQPAGACLFRDADPLRPDGWRAFDGKAFSIHYEDPYRVAASSPAPCAAIAPFQSAVGAVARHSSGAWLAVMQSWKDAGAFPVSGFYYATSRNLTEWSEPRLLLATKTLFDDACGADRLRSYPSLLDPDSTDRNFMTTGDRPWLYYADMRIDGCAHTSDRSLTRARLRVAPAK